MSSSSSSSRRIEISIVIVAKVMATVATPLQPLCKIKTNQGKQRMILTPLASACDASFAGTVANREGFYSTAEQILIVPQNEERMMMQVGSLIAGALIAKNSAFITKTFIG